MARNGRYRGSKVVYTLLVDGTNSIVLECYSMEFSRKARALLNKVVPEWSEAAVSFERRGEVIDNGRLYNS